MSEVNEMVQEVATAGISRRHFVQGAAAVAAGAALPMTQILGGSSVSAAPSKTLRVATGKQEHVAAPWETSGGSLFILSMVGEWLTWQLPNGKLEPRIAESWTSSADAKQWVFKIRKGVKFNDGTPLTVDDIVYTYTSIFDKTLTKGISRSKGNYDNILDAKGVVKVDANTIQFNLLQANGNFPYFVSSACYGMCIIKKDAFGGAGWEKTMISAGPWKMVSHVNTESTMYTKNPYYWDPKFNPGFDNVEFVQFVSAATALPQLKTGKIDFIGGMEAADALALDKAKFQVSSLPAGAGFAHVHMRTNFGPFQDKRIRQAAALTIDRPGYVKGIMKGIGGIVGNDSVMDPYVTADKSVPQRKQDLAKAKELMKAAGVPNGFDVNLSTWARDDINKYAKLIKTSFAKIGIKVNLVIDGSDGGSAVYYTYDPYPSKPGKVNQFENFSWLASNLGIVDWAKENGFDSITWTFDPLVRRNAHFNLVKLGARVLGYHQNFYGELDDGINAGEQSDRVLVRWDVVGVDAPLANTFVEPSKTAFVIETPADIEQLRKTDRVQSDGWRARQRAAFESAELNGLQVVGLTQEFSYVLDKRVETDGAL